jgi:hypothetical protein
MRIVCIADTQGHHRELVVPPGDLLIDAGDFTTYSKPPWLYRHFDLWLGEGNTFNDVVQEVIVEFPERYRDHDWDEIWWIIRKPGARHNRFC